VNLVSTRLLAIVFTVFVFIHFLLLLIYCIPAQNKNTKLSFLSHLYVYPLFHSNWQLFVPAPTKKNQLFVKYKNENQLPVWKDILSAEIKKHSDHPFFGHDLKVLLFSNSFIHAFNELENQPLQYFKSEPAIKEFEVLKFEIDQYLKTVLKVSKQIEYQLMMSSVDENETRSYCFKNLVVK